METFVPQFGRPFAICCPPVAVSLPPGGPRMPGITSR